MSAYDTVAPSFERHRALPACVTEAIRAEILAATRGQSQPRVLDLGAGTGRIGRPFVTAGDEYIGVDVSLGMLREFIRESAAAGRVPCLVSADGERLPFADATFDAVMLIQVIGGARDWRPLVAESRRVLRSPGALVFGKTNMPEDGLDAQMKRQLALLLDEMGVSPYHTNARDRVRDLLQAIGPGVIRVIVDSWTAHRTPREFIERQQTGARFSTLPESIKHETLGKLGTWAAATFGSLDASFSERHEFELLIFKFDQKAGR